MATSVSTARGASCSRRRTLVSRYLLTVGVRDVRPLAVAGSPGRSGAAPAFVGGESARRRLAGGV